MPDVNQRVANLQAGGYNWMPVQTLYSLADSGLSDDEITTAAEQMRRAAVQTSTSTIINPRQARGTAALQSGLTYGIANPNVQRANQIVKQTQQSKDASTAGWKTFWDDPVLQKHPSAALALKQYLSGAIGAWPIQDQHAGDIQRNLQIQGYGRDLKADGNWNAGWNAAQNEWKNATFQSQLAGNRPGSLSVAHAMDALQALTPVSAWNALVGFVMQLPEGGRRLLADVAGGTAGAVTMLSDPNNLRVPFFSEPGQAEKTAYGRTAAAVESALGQPTNPNKEVRQLTGARLLEDASNVIMLASVMGSVGRFAQAAGIGATAADEAALTADAAFRGPGAIARTLSSAPGTGSPVIPRAIVGAVAGGGITTAAGGTPAQILAATVGGGTIGALTGAKAFQNFPVLGNTGAFIDGLADTDGLYYRARRVLAMPYQYRAVQLADTAFQQSLLLGGEARGLAQLQDYAGGNGSTQFSRSVEGTHTFNTIDDAIKNRLGFTILGQHIAPSLNDLMFLFSGRGAAALHAAPSKSVGDVVRAFNDTGTSALGDPGLLISIQRASVNRRFGINQTPTLHTLIDQAGGLENFNTFWTNKIADHAAWFESERRYQDSLIDAGLTPLDKMSDTARTAALRDMAHVVRNDPEQLQAAVAGLRAQQGGEELTVRLKRQIALNHADPAYAGGNRLPQFMEANRLAQRELLPWADVPVGTVKAGFEDAAHSRALLNTTGEHGNMGIAGLDTLTRRPALDQIARWRQQYAELDAEEAAYAQAVRARNTPEGANVTVPEFDATVRDELNGTVNQWLFDNFHIRGNEIAMKSGQETLDFAKGLAQQLAVDVTVHPDAPSFLHDAVARLADMGYKPVAGTDIGHMLHGPAPIDIMDGQLGFGRRAAEHLGLNPTMVPDAPIAQHIWTQQVNEIASSGVPMPPVSDATTVLAYLHAEGVLDTKSPVADAIRQGLHIFPSKDATGVHFLNVPQKLAKQEGWYKDLNKLDSAKALQEMNQALQLRDVNEKKLVQALTNGEAWGKFNSPAAELTPETRTIEEQLAAVAPHGNLGPTTAIPPFSVEDAHKIAAAIRKGYDVPAYMAGASRLENLFRSGLGFVGKAFPNSLGYTIANLPNNLIRVRNELRFDLSPYFSFRRFAKANLKMGLEGIPTVEDPLGALNRAGVTHEARNILERVQPEWQNRAEEEVADTAGRYLQSQDVFGFYNHRNMEAYAAYHLAQQGLTDDEIGQKLTRIFDYGTNGVRGRSALEKSANFFFFPFSFDKTLYRNLGAYLLDKPAQRYIISAGIAAYAEFNAAHANGDNPLATSFVDKHFPIFTEASRLNAFANGISPGEPGGINRPLLNLFLPQSWNPTAGNFQTLKRFIPVFNDFSRVYKEVQDQQHIAKDAFENFTRTVDGGGATTYATGGKWNSPGPMRSMETAQAQQADAFKMQLEWENAAKDYIAGNLGKSAADAPYRFAMDPKWGSFAGEPITKANIRKIVHEAYPVYKPGGAIEAATTAQANFEDYLRETKGQPLHDKVALFAKSAAEFSRMAAAERYDPARQAEITDQLRAQAVYLAERDKKFYALYSRTFGRFLGPLEGVTGG